MKNVRENEVEAYLRRQVEKLGGLCIKIPADYMRGIPDRIVLLPHGVLVWVETKRPSGGRVSGSQLVVHEMLRRNDNVHSVVCENTLDCVFPFLVGYFNEVCEEIHLYVAAIFF